MALETGCGTMTSRNLITICLLLTLAACGGRRRTVSVAVPPPEPRPVSIEIEVYDPVTGFAWENVGVRLVEAYNEWSGCQCISPFPDDWYFTNTNGIVFLAEDNIATAEIGFVEDVLQNAILQPQNASDEAIVTLEIWSPGFAPVLVDVDLSWSAPDAFISVPFL